MLYVLTVATLLSVLSTVNSTARILDEEESPAAGCPASSAPMMRNSEEIAMNSVDSASFSNSDTDDGIPVRATRNLRGMALSRPCCVTSGPGRVDCFFRGLKSNIMQKSVKKTDECCPCKDWTNLGGAALGEVECVSRDDNYIDIFILNSQWHLYLKSYSPDGWEPWIDKGAHFVDVPSCAVRDKNTITCLTRNSGNNGYQISTANGVWGAVTTINGGLSSPMACSARTSAVLDCFAVGWDAALWTKYISSGKWAAWARLDAAYKGERPSVAWNAHRMDVFLLGEKSDIVQKTWNNGWKNPVSLGGVFESAPECVMTTDSKILCFAIGPKSDLFKNTYDGANWSGWVNLFGRYMTEAPSCVISDRHTLSCYLRNIYNEIIEIDFDI